ALGPDACIGRLAQGTKQAGGGRHVGRPFDPEACGRGPVLRPQDPEAFRLVRRARARWHRWLLRIPPLPERPRDGAGCRTGPGRYSIDRAIGWRDTGWVWGLVAILVGVGSAALVLSMRRPPTPATEEQPGPAA